MTDNTISSAVLGASLDIPNDLLTLRITVKDSVGNIYSGEYVTTPATVGANALTGIAYRNFSLFNLPSSVVISNWSTSTWHSNPGLLAATLLGYLQDAEVFFSVVASGAGTIIALPNSKIITNVISLASIRALLPSN